MMAAVCMVCEISMSAAPGGSKGGKKMANRASRDGVILPQLDGT